uniref:Olfactory receptor n=1 Tax=Melopsittacus undulatus TaxID=13146 RepID=A0A8C6IUJ3_MELUD
MFIRVSLVSCITIILELFSFNFRLCNDFILLGFPDAPELQTTIFTVLLSLYVLMVLGNLTMILLINTDPHLHTPMYFFLTHLSCIDFCLSSATIPKALQTFLQGRSHISFWGCFAQMYVYLAMAFYLLTVMSYDRYVAICKPLHYGILLSNRACVHMAAAAWASGFIYALLHTANTFSLPLCRGNAVEQFFCEIPHILKLSCSHSYLREVGLLVLGFSSAIGCFVFIVVSYVQIFRAVLRIPTEQGRHKAFSTCLPHLAVLSLFVSTGSFAYLKPPSISSPSLDLVVSVLYSVVPPAVNPLIYSLRNQELKDAVRKLLTGCV